jgi:hypothetical protein
MTRIRHWRTLSTGTASTNLCEEIPRKSGSSQHFILRESSSYIVTAFNETIYEKNVLMKLIHPITYNFYRIQHKKVAE